MKLRNLQRKNKACPILRLRHLTVFCEFPLSAEAQEMRTAEFPLPSIKKHRWDRTEFDFSTKLNLWPFRFKVKKKTRLFDCIFFTFTIKHTDINFQQLPLPKCSKFLKKQHHSQFHALQKWTLPTPKTSTKMFFHRHYCIKMRFDFSLSTPWHFFGDQRNNRKYFTRILTTTSSTAAWISLKRFRLQEHHKMAAISVN